MKKEERGKPTIRFLLYSIRLLFVVESAKILPVDYIDRTDKLDDSAMDISANLELLL